MFGVLNNFVSCTVMMLGYVVCASCLSSLCLLLVPVMLICTMHMLFCLLLLVVAMCVRFVCVDVCVVVWCMYTITNLHMCRHCVHLWHAWV